MRFDISNFTYYANGNVFTGSRNTFSFRVAGEEGRLRAAVWYGLFPRDLSEIAAEKDFDLTPEGLEEVRAFLEEQYAVYEEKGL